MPESGKNFCAVHSRLLRRASPADFRGVVGKVENAGTGGCRSPKMGDWPPCLGRLALASICPPFFCLHFPWKNGGMMEDSWRRNRGVKKGEKMEA